MVALAFRLPRKSDPSDLWLSTQGTCREGGRIQPLRHPLDSRGLGSTWVHAGVGDLGLEVMQLLGQAVGISGGWQGMGRHPPHCRTRASARVGPLPLAIPAWREAAISPVPVQVPPPQAAPRVGGRRLERIAFSPGSPLCGARPVVCQGTGSHTQHWVRPAGPSRSPAKGA